MTFFDRDHGTDFWRATPTPRALLLVGMGIFLHCAHLAMFLSLYDSDGEVWRLSLTGRQGYVHGWIIGFGLACWG